MSNPDSNVQIVQAIYAAFGKGDVAAILARVTDEAEFSFEGGSSEVPWHGPFRGHDGLRRFFGSIAEEVEFQSFEPLAFAAGPDVVAARLHLRYRVRRTGRTVDENQVHWWSVKGGKVVGLVHFEDTAQVLAATRR